jgi:cardiolipin synthase
MGNGVGSIVIALEEMLTDAKREIHILAYSVSDGAERLFALLANRLSEGVRVTMIVQRLDQQHNNAPEHLKRLVALYPGLFLLFDFTPEEQEALHAKCVIVDRQTAFVGSANLSFNGLIRNHELGVIIVGSSVNDLVGIIEQLQTHPDAHLVREPIFESRVLTSSTSD